MAEKQIDKSIKFEKSQLYYRLDDMIDSIRHRPDFEDLYKFSIMISDDGKRRFGWSVTLPLSKNVKGKPMYELIPFKGKLPLYLDCEWYTDKEEPEVIDSLLSKFEEWWSSVSDVKISKITKLIGTREKVIDERVYIKNSWHLIIRFQNWHIATQKDMLIILKKFENWCANNNNYEFSYRCPRSKLRQFLIDTSVYNKNNGTYQNYRMPLACKSLTGDENDCMKIVGARKDYNGLTKHYAECFVSHRINPDSKPIELPSDWVIPPKVHHPYQKSKYIRGKIPEDVEKRVVQIFKSHHEDGKLIGCKTKDNGYIFEFHTDQRCLICNREKKTNKGNYIFYYPNSFEYQYGCYTEKTKMIYLNPRQDIDKLIKWDYEYEDRQDINCDPLLSTDKLPEGGTFILESQKGTGKTESLIKFLGSEFKKNKNLSVLILTYRISLATKYDQELSQFGFHYYKQPIKQKTDFNRYITLIDSFHRLVNQKNDLNFKMENYDVIIMDEVYSVLEGWNSSLMGNKKVYLMNIFELFMKKCKYLYLMDAHLNTKLVINTVSKLRNPNKFIAHRNPQCHNYSDYTVNWYEPKRIKTKLGKWIQTKEKIHINKFLREMVENLKMNKKIAFVSATKRMCDDIQSKIEDMKKKNELDDDFKYYVYTGETSIETKQNELKNVEETWKNANLVIYSPTISAGISFNIATLEHGFDQIYAYLRCSGGASYNTLVQMMARVRRLLDKKINIFFDKDENPVYRINENQVDNLMKQDCETLFDAMGKDYSRPVYQHWGLDENFKHTFDTEHWTYVQWVETTKSKLFYSKNDNFKKSMIAELTNHPRDMRHAGRGMMLVDHSLETSHISEEDLIEINEFKSDVEQAKKHTILNKIDIWRNIEVPNEANISDICERMDRGENINDTELIQYNKYMIEKNLYIDWSLVWRETDEDLADGGFEKLIDFRELDKFNRYKYWINMEYEDTDLKQWLQYSYDKYLNEHYWLNIEKVKAVNDKQEMRFLQAMDIELKEGFTSLHGLQQLIDIFDRPDLFRNDLTGKIITKKEFENICNEESKKKVTKIHSIMKKYFHKAIPKLLQDDSKFKHARVTLENWYNDPDNNGKHLYEEIKVGQERLNFLNKNHLAHGLDDFKTFNWKPKYGKKREKFDAMCKSGEWSCPDWNLLKPHAWSVTQLKNSLGKCLEYSLGYEFADLDGVPRWKKQTIVSQYDWLNTFRNKNNKELDFLSDNEDEIDSLNYIKPKKKKLVIVD